MEATRSGAVGKAFADAHIRVCRQAVKPRRQAHEAQSKVDSAVSNSPIHDMARDAIRHVRHSRRDEDIEFLTSYIDACETTSRDMKNAVQAIVDLFGPDGLMKVQKRVEAARISVKLVQ
jgi:hypothetical protein